MVLTKEKPVAESATRSDTYRTLLVHAEPGLASTHRVEVAARLARDLDATLMGLGAESFNPVPTGDPFMGYAAGDWVALVQEQVTVNLRAADTAFHRDAAGAELEWRSVEDYPHSAITRLAHAADLIIVSPRSAKAPTATADPADVIMSAGRPVLVVPDGRERLHGMAVVVAWKDSRECRRAIADAMPFLRRADEVIVQAVCEGEAADEAEVQLDNVVRNLKRHGVEARRIVTPAHADRAVDELNRIADLNDADLIVAGAYGHSRLREWALGGVTNELLHRPQRFVLFSH